MNELHRSDLEGLCTGREENGVGVGRYMFNIRLDPKLARLRVRARVCVCVCVCVS